MGFLCPHSLTKQERGKEKGRKEERKREGGKEGMTEEKKVGRKKEWYRRIEKLNRERKM